MRDRPHLPVAAHTNGQTLNHSRGDPDLTTTAAADTSVADAAANDTAETRILAWVDVETTGLDANTCALLEVACIITDTDLNELSAEPFHATIQHTNADELRAGANEYVQNMHDQTGLWGRLADGTPADQVDQQLRAFIAEHAPTKRTARLAGNSVRLDLNFLETHLPAAYSHLHYRSVDVTAVASVTEEWWQVPKFDKARTHAALDDIRESINELRHIRTHIENRFHNQQGADQ